MKTSLAKQGMGYSGLAVVLLWGVSFIAARLFLDQELQQSFPFPTWLRVSAVLIPIVPTALFLWAVITHV